MAIGGHGPDRATLATVQTTEQNAPETPSPRAVLDALDFVGEVEVYEAPQPELQAMLETPEGPMTL